MMEARIRFEKHAGALINGCVNFCLDRWVGGARRPVHFDIAATAPALQRLTENWGVIRAELDHLLAAGRPLPKYHELDPHVARISAGDGPAWRVYLLAAMGGTPPAAARECPRTVALLKETPAVFQAFFSVLEPGKSVAAHRGPSRGYLRYHLGLRIPAERPPRIRVKDWTHQWREGEAVLFDDSWEHEVLNDSPGFRSILVVDILRPLPPFPYLLERLFMRFIAWPAYGRHLIKRMG